MNQTRVIVLGEDPRQEYLCQELNSIGFSAFYYPQGNFEDITLPEGVSCIVYPLFPPVKLLYRSLDYCKPQALLCAGLPSKEFILTANEHGFSVYDYMSDKEVAQRNAVATAEGAIAEGLRLCRLNLQGSNCLVFGYGMCGEILAEKCKALGANVTVCDCDSFKMAHAQSHGLKIIWKISDLSTFSYIFNTVPAPLLTATLLDTMSPDGVIIDLASSPGGTDFDTCLRKKIPAKLCPSLPAIYAPKSSGIIVANAIKRHLGKD